MELLVKIRNSHGNEEATEYRVSGFGDLAKIGTALGRTIMQWLRRVPVRAQESRAEFSVCAQWVEPKPEAAPRGQLLRTRAKARKRGAH